MKQKAYELLETFIESNSKKWNVKINKYSGSCLIEGLGLWVTQVHQVARCGKVIEEKYAYKPYVLLNDKNERSDFFVKLYKSYNIYNFIYFKNYLGNFFLLIKVFFYFIFFRKSISDNTKFKGILIGDLYIDTLLASKRKSSFFNKERLRFILIFNYFVYKNILRKYNIKYVVLGDKQYMDIGLLHRISIFNDIKVIVSAGPRVKAYNKSNYLQSFFHPGIPYNEIVLANNKSSKEIVTILEDRMSGHNKQHDAKNAYENKIEYTREMFLQHLNIQNSKPLVFLFPHIFKDSPHGSEYLLFEDYYDWFKQTIICLGNNRNINVVVKPHPSAYMYGEDNIIESYIKNIENVYLCPKDFNNHSLIDCCDYIVTCQGTVALEFACFGLKAVVAGAGYYNGYGIVKEFSTSLDYLMFLKNLDEEECNSRLSTEIKDKALQIFYYIYNTEIIDKLFPSEIMYNNDVNNEELYWKKIYNNLKELLENMDNKENNLYLYSIKKTC